MFDKAKAKEALALAKKGGVHYNAFFNNLKTAAWIPFLVSQHVFDEPPKPIQEDNTIAFPTWPATKYLVRMASQEEAVALIGKIVLKIKTENIRVHEDVADIALALPTEVSVGLLPQFQAWLNSPYQMLIFEKLFKLSIRWANEGKVGPAIQLTGKLISIPKADNDEEDPEDRGAIHQRFVFMKHGDTQQVVIETLSRAGGLDALKIFCDRLQQAMGKKSKKSRFDPSLFWRSHLTGDGGWHTHETENTLISMVRDSSIVIIESGVVPPEDVFAFLEKYSPRIFLRIRLFLAEKFLDRVPDIAAKLLVSKRYFNDRWLEVEYFPLISRGFFYLSEKDKKRILTLIKKGPDIEEKVESYEKRSNMKATVEQIDGLVGRWTLDKLKPIIGGLSEEWRSQYASLVNKYGESESPTPPVSMELGYGSRSPKSAQDLMAMDVLDIVEYLKTWKETNEWKAATRDGLVLSLVEAVKNFPDKFSNVADKFIGLHPAYIEAVFRGIRNAVGGQKEFSWKNILGLGVLALAKVDDQKQSGNTYNYEVTWRDVRCSLDLLIDNGLEDVRGGLTLGERDLVWEILQVLSADPEPAPMYEKHELNENNDPATLSINTVRGRAMHSVVAYAAWVFRLKRLTYNAGFGEVPEVKATLEAHLDKKNDPSLVVHSIYAQKLNVLTWLDKQWVIDRFSDIFPIDENMEKYKEVSWECYIAYCQADDALVDLLKPLYLEAARKSGNVPSVSSGLISDNRERLAGHIVTLYCRGDIGMESGSIMDLFLKNAPEIFRERLIWMIGKLLEDWPTSEKEKEDSPKIIERLVVFIEQRIALLETKPDEVRKELDAFGWWFSSGKFDDKWSLGKLYVIARAKVSIDVPDRVVARLTELFGTYPTDCLNCLMEILGGISDPWRVSIFKEELGGFLRLAAASGDPEIKVRVKETIDFLGRQGYVDFLKILE